MKKYLAILSAIIIFPVLLFCRDAYPNPVVAGSDPIPSYAEKLRVDLWMGDVFKEGSEAKDVTAHYAGVFNLHVRESCDYSWPVIMYW